MISSRVRRVSGNWKNSISWKVREVSRAICWRKSWSLKYWPHFVSCGVVAESGSASSSGGLMKYSDLSL